MVTYNTKIIDFGNGKKQVVTYEKPVVLSDIDYDVEKSTVSNKNIIELSDNEIERRKVHSFFTSANRTKNEIYKIARANSWDYFITFTFDKNKVDRTNYDLIMKKVTKYFNNWKQRKCPNLKYLLIPEQHKRIESNGLHAWHFHGLISNCDGLTFIELSDNDKKYYDIQCDYPVYTIKEYKLGFCTATIVLSDDKVSHYITKYITKSLCGLTQNKRRYLYSRNCDKPKEYFYHCYNGYEPIVSVSEDGYQKMINTNIALQDLVDISKIKFTKRKDINVDGFINSYQYFELEDDYTPALQGYVKSLNND